MNNDYCQALATIEYEPIADEKFRQNMIDEGRYHDINAIHRLGGKTRKEIKLEERNRTYPMSEKFIERQKMLKRMTKDRNEVQVNKYFNIIFKSLERDDFTSARKNTELLTDLMERINYKEMPEILDYIYNWFGAHQLLTFPDVEEWDERTNHRRAKFFLGQYSVEDPYELEKSLYGVDIVHSK